MTNYHNHAAYKTDEADRFVILKSLHLGCHGPAGSEYIAIDTTGEARDSFFDNLTQCKCWIARHRDGLKCAPLFGNNAPDGHIRDRKIKLINHPEYAEITGT